MAPPPPLHRAQRTGCAPWLPPPPLPLPPPPPLHRAQRTGCAPWLAGAALSVPCAPFAPFAPTNAAQGAEHMTRQWEPPASPISKAVEASVASMGPVFGMENDGT